jgi:hypothetical protein
MTIDVTKIPEGYTEEEWEGLSDVEKEGIIESITEPEGGEVDETIPEDTLKKIADDNLEDGKKPYDPPAADDNKKTDDDAAVTDDALLSFRAVVTDDDLKIEEVVPDDLKNDLDALKSKYDEGDMSIHEYTEARDAINRKIYKHNAGLEAEAKTEIIWKKEQFHFLKNRPEYLPGQQAEATGKIRANALFGALSETIKSLSQDEANANLSGMQLLVKADGIVKDAFGLKQKPVEKKEEKKPPAPLPDHKTLSDVPAAGKNDTADDAFSQLDKLTGEAYEEALERLTPEMRDAYLSRA